MSTSRNGEKRRFLMSGEDVAGSTNPLAEEEYVKKGVFKRVEDVEDVEDSIGHKKSRVPVPDPRNSHIDQETGEYIPHSSEELTKTRPNGTIRVDSHYVSRQTIEINRSIKNSNKWRNIGIGILGFAALGVTSLIHFKDDIRARFHVNNEQPVVVEEVKPVVREIPRRVDQNQYVKGSFERLRKTFDTNDNNFVWNVPQGIGKLEAKVVEEAPVVVQTAQNVTNVSIVGDNDYVVKRMPKQGQGLGEVIWDALKDVAYPTKDRLAILYGPKGNDGLVTEVALDNNLVNPNILPAGKEVVIRFGKHLRGTEFAYLLERKAPEEVVHEVTSGESLSLIVQDYMSKYKVNAPLNDFVNGVCKDNGIKNCNLIMPRQKIRINPGSENLADIIMAGNQFSALEEIKQEIGARYVSGERASNIANDVAVFDVNDVHRIGAQFAETNGIMFTKFDYRRHDVATLSNKAKELYALSGNKTEVQKELTKMYGKMSWHTADKLIRADYEVLKVA